MRSPARGAGRRRRPCSLRAAEGLRGWRRASPACTAAGRSPERSPLLLGLSSPLATLGGSSGRSLLASLLALRAQPPTGVAVRCGRSHSRGREESSPVCVPPSQPCAEERGERKEQKGENGKSREPPEGHRQKKGNFAERGASVQRWKFHLKSFPREEGCLHVHVDAKQAHHKLTLVLLPLQHDIRQGTVASHPHRHCLATRRC